MSECIQTSIIKKLRLTLFSKAVKVHSGDSKLGTKWLKKLRLDYKCFFVNAHQPLDTTRDALSTSVHSQKNKTEKAF